MKPVLRHVFRILTTAALLWAGQAEAVTYANVSVPFNWIVATGHTKVGPVTGGIYSASYAFRQVGGATACGTAPPTIDDTLTDRIPIGFNFMFSGQLFDSLRIMSNGRLQFTRIGAPAFDNITCGFGSAVTQLPFPIASLNYTMRIYGNDLDPTLQSEVAGYVTPCQNRNTCFVSYAPLGVAPYRSFVVTWSHVPEWAAGATATGDYNLQIILQENGEFIYQYGTDVPGAGNVNAQIGWQADLADYNVPSVGFPANNSAIKFYIPAPVAEYRMEQPVWNPALVLDTSGNNRNGTALGLAQTVPGGKVCRGANIPANILVGTIDAINTGIAVPATVGGAGTITFWYKGNTAWSGAGVVDAQLLDASVVNGQWFYLVRRSTGQLYFAITDTTGVTQVAQTGAIAVAAGTYKHISVSWNFNAIAGALKDHMVIYVDGVAQITQTFTTAGTVSASVGTLYIGDNRSAFTLAPGTGNSANGVIDEFRIYNYEGGIALVQRDMNLTQVCLNHYAITDAGVGQTCAVNQVTVTAHDAAHGTVLMPNNTTTITLSTSTGLGDWSLLSGYGVLNNGAANDGAATYLFNGEYQAVFGLSHAVPGTVTVGVTDGQIVQQENTSLVITSCTFNAFETSTIPNPGATGGFIKTKVAGNIFALDVVAISGGVQLASFNNNVQVELLANTGTPGIGYGADNCPTANSVVQTIASAAIAGGRSTVNFSAVANVFQDMRVRISYPTVSPTITTCSTDSVAIRPNAFSNFSISDSNWTTAGTARSLTDKTFGNIMHKAGRPFSIRADARNSVNVVTTNYTGSPTVVPTLCVGAACTTSWGTVTLGTPFGAGVLATDTATYNQVGSFTAQLVDSSFAGIDIGDGSTAAERNIQSATVDVGRFVPDHFAVAPPAAPPAFGTVCSAGGFAYVGQTFSYTTQPVITVTAQDALNNTTTLYTGNWWRITNPSLTKTYSALSGSLDTSAAAAATDPVIAEIGGSPGRGTLSFGSGTGFLFTRTTPVPAFDAEIGLSVNVVDGDAVAYATNPFKVGDATATNGIAFSSGKNFRFGRLRVLGVNGSNRVNLQVPLVTEYWATVGPNTGWTTNLNDVCTSITDTDIRLFNWQPAGFAPDPCKSRLSIIGGGNTMTAAAGRFNNLRLTAPGGAISGGVDLQVKLNGVNPATDKTCILPGPNQQAATNSAKPWLQGAWGAATYNQDPAARVTFGTYTNTNQFIYQRENY